MAALQQLKQQQQQLGSLHWYQHCHTAHTATSGTDCLHSATQQQQQQQQRAADEHIFSAEDLSTLRLLLTAAKVLFCGGALSVALQLLQLLLPVQKAAAAAVQPSHLSSIRNEAAYAALIHKLLTEAPPEPLDCSGTCSEVLYACGDSHILPGIHPSLQPPATAAYKNPEPKP
jgi:hypothetical protein